MNIKQKLEAVKENFDDLERCIKKAVNSTKRINHGDKDYYGVGLYDRPKPYDFIYRIFKE